MCSSFTFEGFQFFTATSPPLTLFSSFWRATCTSGTYRRTFASFRATLTLSTRRFPFLLNSWSKLLVFRYRTRWRDSIRASYLLSVRKYVPTMCNKYNGTSVVFYTSATFFRRSRCWEECVNRIVTKTFVPRRTGRRISNVEHSIERSQIERVIDVCPLIPVRRGGQVNFSSFGRTSHLYKFLQSRLRSILGSQVNNSNQTCIHTYLLFFFFFFF